jgi:16S rRNA (uracil1498-N3)-methyltransferase
MKQSRKPWKPVVNEMIPFKDFISMPREGRKFIAHCYQEIEKNDLFDIINKDKDNENITILVGPEGDFSIDEVRFALENGYESISLGQSRLRTETAGLMAVTMSQLSLRL